MKTYKVIGGGTPEDIQNQIDKLFEGGKPYELIGTENVNGLMFLTFELEDKSKYLLPNETIDLVSRDIENSVKDNYEVKHTKINGIDLILNERQKQLGKGYLLKGDSEYGHSELIRVAAFLLTEDNRFWPVSWDLSRKHKFIKKTYLEQLAIAGALIAAQMDLIIHQSKEDGK